MSDWPLEPVVIQRGSKPLIDEDEVIEITTFGDPCPQFLRHGLDVAEAYARQQYIEGAIEAEDFEAELERLWRKREQPL